MPIINGVGQSPETPTKQRHFAGFLTMQMLASKGVMDNPHNKWLQRDYYQYIDLYAGPGTWGDGQLGSPLIFLERIERYDLPYRAHFFEIDKENAEQLIDTIPAHQIGRAYV